MELIQLQKGQSNVAPRIFERSFYPNIDSSFTVRTYQGDRIAGINMDTHSYGIKSWGSGMATNGQGIAIYGNILVRTWNLSTGNLKIYQIGTGNVLTQLASATVSIGHGNALQFASVLEDGQTYPYLYAVGLNGKGYVLSIAANYTVTLEQTITIDGVSQILKGDDGYIWTSSWVTGGKRRFDKYRKVLVSEGDVILTDEDILDSFITDEAMPSETYTAQGWKVKFGRIWYCYGASGSGQNRGIKVYDTATHRLVSTIDLSDYTTAEFEDVEFHDNSLILATFGSGMYMLRF